MTAELIFHIAAASEWETAQHTGSYHMSTRGATLAEIGFIHCSRRPQVAKVAAASYRDQSGLVLLTIDPDRVEATVRYEDLEGGAELFPHVYGPLNLDAVVAVEPV